MTTKVNNIIGPINLDDWYWMRQLRESIKDARSVDPIKYKVLIDMHSKFYKEELQEVVNRDYYSSRNR